MNLGLMTALLFICMTLALISGLPLSFALGAVGVLFAVSLWGPASTTMFFLRAWETMNNWVLLAVPLFVFMGMMLRYSGIADDLYEMMYRWFGRLRGGLAVGTVMICTIFAAMVGIVGASTTTMGLLAIPSMLKRNYNKDIALGCVAAGGALGCLIPPSIVMIVYALYAGQSVSELYTAAFLPGLMLSALYILYIIIRCYLQPQMGPALPREERFTMREKLVSLRAVAIPLVIIILVLGSIFTGIATPTESSAIGAAATTIAAIARRRCTWQVLKESCLTTLSITSMVLWVLIGATGFSTTYNALGASQFLKELITGFPGGAWAIIAFMMVTFFILGCFMDDIPILMITGPVYIPIIMALGFNPVWYAILWMINMQMGYLTPPFGFVLFYLRAVVPEGVTMSDIYRSIVPFVGLQALGLVICIIFPQVVLWLPSVMSYR